MTRHGTRDELQARLARLSAELEAAEKKFSVRGRRPDGAHMGHLAEIRGRFEDLEQKVRGADGSLWESMKQTWHADMEALRGSFERAVKYEDEEFRQGGG